jgi:GTPase Era involved in 16S rRNA processing
MAANDETWGGLGLELAISEARRVAQIMDQCGRPEEAKQLADAADLAATTRFAIGVVGRTKRGKSTLINGILGRKDDLLAPVEKEPATNVVTCFASGDKEEAWAVFSQDGEPRRADPISFSQIKSYVCEKDNPENVKGVSRIEVIAPFTRLPSNVVLVDTPGSHNALSHAHGEVLLKYLPRLDAVIFLISADAPLVEAELDLLANIRSCDISKILFAMNKADKVDGDELAEGTAHNRKVLASIGFGEAELFAISAKQYMQTGVDLGVEKLLVAINRLVGEEKGRIISNKLEAMTARLRDTVQASCAEELSAAEKTDGELRIEIEAVTDVKSRLASGRTSRERNFRRQWRESIATFEDSLPGVRNQVLAECRDLIEKTSSLQFAALGQTLHTTIVKKLDDALQTHMQRMRTELEEAAKSLEVDFAMQLKSLDGAGDHVKTPTSASERTVATIGSGVIPTIGALVCTQIPGLVATAVLTSAPTVAAVVWWNPLTWAMAVGTGAAAGGVSLAAGTAGVLLAPVAAIGTPVLLGYAGYKVATTWIARNAQTRDELAMAAKDRIEQLVGELRTNISRLKRKDDEVLSQFDDLLESQLESHRIKLEEYSSRRQTPERIAELRRSIALLGCDASSRTGKVKSLPAPLF